MCGVERERGDGVPDVQEVVGLCASGLSEGGVEVVAKGRRDGGQGMVLLLLLVVGVEVGGKKVETGEEGGDEGIDWGMLV